MTPRRLKKLLLRKNKMAQRRTIRGTETASVSRQKNFIELRTKESRISLCARQA